MFYSTDSNAHGLSHDPFKAIVSPRPIGWIGTRASDGSHNLAPYSFFNAICDVPKLVMFSSGGRKDSIRNIEETGEFTASFVGRALSEAMNITSAVVPHGESEFELAGLTPVVGQLVSAPYVGEAFAALECRVTESFREEAIRDGRFDAGLVRPIGRMGYMDYCDAGDVFEMMRPKRP
jgi:flavin reductase (DIM6/NTAB) family NADH-FMN oxidoreductase RutF